MIHNFTTTFFSKLILFIFLFNSEQFSGIQKKAIANSKFSVLTSCEHQSVSLYEKGIVNNRLKKKYNSKVVSSFVTGTKKVFDFIHDNPMVNLLNTAYVNDTSVIKQIPKMVAINSAIEVDLTGQVCADSIGNQVFSGIGGQMDFIRGASLSNGGIPIIALSALTSKGESKIVTNLKMGAGVVTTRANVHFVVTEYGVVNLYGKNLKQRAEALINIAHPAHREQLNKEAFYLTRQ